MKGDFEFRFATFHEQLVVEKIIHSQYNLIVSHMNVAISVNLLVGSELSHNRDGRKVVCF